MRSGATSERGTPTVTESASPSGADAQNQAAELNCLRCGAVMESLGIEEFRTGGTSGGIKLLIGEWGELGEEKLPFELLVCPTCRFTEFRAAW
jgi:hypothetical protein